MRELYGSCPANNFSAIETVFHSFTYDQLIRGSQMLVEFNNENLDNFGKVIASNIHDPKNREAYKNGFYSSYLFLHLFFTLNEPTVSQIDITNYIVGEVSSIKNEQPYLSNQEVSQRFFEGELSERNFIWITSFLNSPGNPLFKLSASLDIFQTHDQWRYLYRGYCDTTRTLTGTSQEIMSILGGTEGNRTPA